MVNKVDEVNKAVAVDEVNEVNEIDKDDKLYKIDVTSSQGRQDRKFSEAAKINVSSTVSEVRRTVVVLSDS